MECFNNFKTILSNFPSPAFPESTAPEPLTLAKRIFMSSFSSFVNLNFSDKRSFSSLTLPSEHATAIDKRNKKKS